MDLPDLLLTAKNRRKAVGEAFLLGLIGLTLSGLLFVNTKYLPATLLWRKILNSGHLLLFMALGYIILRLTNFNSGLAHTWPVRHYFKSLFWGAGFAIFSEWLQQFVGREFEICDILLNLAGLLISHATHFLWANRKKISGLNIITKSLAVSGPIVILLAVFWDLFVTAHHMFYLERQLPVITSFENNWELFRWEAHGNTRIRIVTDEANSGQHFLKVSSQTGTFPGVTLEYPPPDWQRYPGISFKVFSPEQTVFVLSVRIDAQSDVSPKRNSVYFTFEVKPGSNEFTISSQEIRTRATKAPFNFSNVRRIVFFLNRPKHPRVYYLDEIIFIESWSE